MNEMTLLQALLMSVVGISLIMAVLFFFMVLIRFTSFLTKIYETQRQKRMDKKMKPAYAEGTCGNLTLVDTPEKDAALIMAITAHRLDTPLNMLRFKSIKLIDEEK